MPLFAKGFADFDAPPYLFSDVTSVKIKLPGCTPKLQTFCDRTLNVALVNNKSKARPYTVRSNIVHLVISKFGKAWPEARSSRFFSSYLEMAILIEVDNGELSFYMPILFIDKIDQPFYMAAAPIVLGRELFGLPKTVAKITFEDYAGSCIARYPAAATMALSLGGTITFGPNSEILQNGLPPDTFIDAQDVLWDEIAEHEWQKALNDEYERTEADASFEARYRNLLLEERRIAGRLGRRLDILELPAAKWSPEALSKIVDGASGFVGADDLVDLLKRTMLRRTAGLEALDEASEGETYPDRSELMRMLANYPIATSSIPVRRLYEDLGLSYDDGTTYDTFKWVGLRQLHQPGTKDQAGLLFGETDHTSIVQSKFELNTTKMHTAKFDYRVTFSKSLIRGWLGLKGSYDVDFEDVEIFDSVDARYGKSTDRHLL